MRLLNVNLYVRVAAILLALGSGSATRAESSFTPGGLSDTEIRKLLVDRIGTGYHGVGIVVGVIGPGGRRVIPYGTAADGHVRTLDGDTVFELGSVTKTFTGLLLADMVDKGEVQLSEPVQELLPASVHVPSRDGHVITLQNLITNTSGLPDNPLSVDPTRYADFHLGYAASVDQLYDLMNRIHLDIDPGSQIGHSNIGVGLLGQALALKSGMGYEKLLKVRITSPLGMRSTAVTQTPDMISRRAVPHDAFLRPEVDLEMGALLGAGGIKSTANDMLKLLAAELGYVKTPLKEAMATQVSAVRLPFGSFQMALQVVISKGPAGDIVWTNGGTFGQQSFVGFDLQRRVGVVALVNASGGARLVDDIGLHILAGAPLATVPPPPPPPPERRTIAVDASVLDRYVGQYQLTPALAVRVFRDGSRLFAQLTGQDSYEIFPSSQTTFYWKVVDGQATFEVDKSGLAADLVMVEGGQSMTARRIESTRH
jgi:D-alanyl-D-alanine-carboxypeptidase/D-alanyl-D-alanine-endopeptidase